MTPNMKVSNKAGKMPSNKEVGWEYVDINQYSHANSINVALREGKRFYRLYDRHTHEGRVYDAELDKISINRVSLYDPESNDAYMALGDMPTLEEMERFIKCFNI